MFIQRINDKVIVHDLLPHPLKLTTEQAEELSEKIQQIILNDYVTEINRKG